MTRVGASQVFFNVVAGFNARKLISDYRAQMTVLKAVSLDSFEAMLKPVEDLSKGLDIYLGTLKEVSQEMGFATVEFEKFFGTENQKNTDHMAKAIKEIGLEYGVVGDEALIAGARAAQVAQIIGEENVPLLVRQAEILHQISDLTSEEAMKSIISLQQQTGVLYGELNAQQFQRLSQLDKEALLTQQSAYALDSLNTIANRSVAVEGELVEVMTNFASQGALVGETFHDMAAMSAVLLESGEQAGAAGRALRMMYARLGGDIGGARTEMEQMGFTVRRENGDLMTMTEIIQGLSDKGWDRMSSAQKQNIAQTVAGNRHYVRFIKLMENQERAVQLSADALNDVDSAATQAEEAMKNYANQLKIAEATGENLKAELGEMYNPFLVGQQKARNDMMEAQKVFASMFGPKVMEGLGRMQAFGQMAGGFIKMSLGVQTMAIGVEMFDAVQRDLHGILIANENLHSKEATWLEENVRVTFEQTQILGRMRYIQQQINRYKQEEQQAALLLTVLEREREPLIEAEARWSEAISEKHKRIYDTNRATASIKRAMLIMEDQSLSVAERQNALIEEDLKGLHTEMDLLAQFNAIKASTESSDQAKRRQMLIDAETMNLLTDENIEQMKERKLELEGTQGIFQRIVADNERLRGIQETRAGTASPKSIIFNPQVVKDADAAIKQVGRTIVDLETQIEAHKGEEWAKEKIDDWKFKLKGQKKLNDDLRAYVATQELQNLHGAAYNSKFKKLNKEGLIFQGWSASSFAAASQQSHNATNEIIHYDNNLNKLNATVYTQSSLEGRLSALMMDRKLTTETLMTFQEQLTRTQDKLNVTDDEYRHLQELIDDAINNRADATKNLTRVQMILSGQVEGTKEELDGFLAGAKKDRFDTKMIEATKHTKKFGYALTSVASVGLPMFFGGTRSAVASTVMLTSSLIPAVYQLGKSTYAMVRHQIAAYAAATSAKAFAGSMALMGTPVALAMWAILDFTSAQEDANAAMERGREIVESFDSSMEHLTNQTHLLADGTILQGMIDLDVSIKELYEDSQVFADTMDYLNNVDTTGWSKEQKDALDNLKDTMMVIASIDNKDILFMDEAEMKKNAKAVRENFEGWGEWGDQIDYFLGSSEKEYKAYMKLVEDFGKDSPLGDVHAETGQQAFGLLDWTGADMTYYEMDKEQFANAIVDMMMEGTQFSSAQMALIKQGLEDWDSTISLIETMNEQIITEGDRGLFRDAIYGDKEAAEVNAEIENTTRDLENLTDSIYDFGNAREELFFGGRYGNVTGSLYKQVVKQGVGVLYNKMDIVMSNNFNGFFNEKEAAERIIRVLNEVAPSLTTG